MDEQKQAGDPNRLQMGGGHYKDRKIEPWDYFGRNDLDGLSSSIIRYIARHKDKNGAEDIRKVIHYGIKLISLYHGENLISASFGEGNQFGYGRAGDVQLIKLQHINPHKLNRELWCAPSEFSDALGSTKAEHEIIYCVTAHRLIENDPDGIEALICRLSIIGQALTILNEVYGEDFSKEIKELLGETPV